MNISKIGVVGVFAVAVALTTGCEVKVNNPDNPPPTQAATATPTTPVNAPPPAPAPPVSR